MLPDELSRNRSYLRGVPPRKRGRSLFRTKGTTPCDQPPTMETNLPSGLRYRGECEKSAWLPAQSKIASNCCSPNFCARCSSSGSWIRAVCPATPKTPTASLSPHPSLRGIFATDALSTSTYSASVPSPRNTAASPSAPQTRSPTANDDDRPAPSPTATTTPAKSIPGTGGARRKGSQGGRARRRTRSAGLSATWVIFRRRAVELGGRVGSGREAARGSSFIHSGTVEVPDGPTFQNEPRAFGRSRNFRQDGAARGNTSSEYKAIQYRSPAPSAQPREIQTKTKANAKAKAKATKARSKNASDTESCSPIPVPTAPVGRQELAHLLPEVLALLAVGLHQVVHVLLGLAQRVVDLVLDRPAALGLEQQAVVRAGVPFVEALHLVHLPELAEDGLLLVRPALLELVLAGDVRAADPVGLLFQQAELLLHLLQHRLDLGHDLVHLERVLHHDLHDLGPLLRVHRLEAGDVRLLLGDDARDGHGLAVVGRLGCAAAGERGAAFGRADGFDAHVEVVVERGQVLRHGLRVVAEGGEQVRDRLVGGRGRRRLGRGRGGYGLVEQAEIVVEAEEVAVEGCLRSLHIVGERKKKSQTRQSTGRWLTCSSAMLAFRASRIASTLFSSTKSIRDLSSSPGGRNMRSTWVSRSICIVFSSFPFAASRARMSCLKSRRPKSRRTWYSISWRSAPVWALRMTDSSCIWRALVARSWARSTSAIEESDCLAARRCRTSTSTGTSSASNSGAGGSWYEVGRERGPDDGPDLGAAIARERSRQDGDGRGVRCLH
ncbi:760dcc6e-ba5c-40b9-8ed4-6482f6a99a0f [Thermothielavioides terrestris]|uniref:760dcc6e-ba5c-40b9-8ed4-6482f6a99a0f n=1 Tax=Thermothielavioides terrestris TaxID=2587410 RepID=A0A446BKQ1_9PEZI|nr:760dcc6e-ba5c-40b9-8ed4-6482f6a99a0f [Thermothielavioides terrestris]